MLKDKINKIEKRLDVLEKQNRCNHNERRKYYRLFLEFYYECEDCGKIVCLPFEEWKKSAKEYFLGKIKKTENLKEGDV